MSSRRQQPRAGRLRHRVVVVLVDGMSALEPAVAHDFLGVDPRIEGVPWYRYGVCAPGPSPITVGGLPVEVRHGVELIGRADTVVIPGWCGVGRCPPPELRAALAAAHRRGTRLVSFCTGAFALAHAGALDGRRATTHWAFAEELRSQFPSVRVDPAVLYVEDGPVLTSAGAAASIDLALHLIRTDYGADVANRVARMMVVPPHRAGGQAQFVDMPMAERSAGDDPLAEVMAWAMSHLDQPLGVADLAGRAALSSRHFGRLFRERTGTTPHQWLLVQRTALAQRLLETTDDPVEHVATAAGFGSAAALRLHFQKALRTSPQAYRRTFRRRAV